ncbi:MAG: hypothetical protein QF530_06110 [SAR202 cluster bacterium]|nr:hypothetical protein [SAR202 cluster bacterium]
MARKKTDGPTRQLFATIREDIYLLAKAKSAENRLSMRSLLEQALLLYLEVKDEIHREEVESDESRSVWEDEYLGMQADRPMGTPVELSDEEAKKIAKEAFL